jgi:hypothetical protein
MVCTVAPAAANAAGRDRRGRAVGTVEHDAEAVQPPGQGADDVVDVLAPRSPRWAHPSDRPRRRGRSHGSRRRFSIASSVASASLCPPAGEELDAVVGHRVVAGGDHHAPGRPSIAAREVRDRRGRQHSHALHVDAGRSQARDHRGLQELPGRARVTSHHRQRPARASGGRTRRLRRARAPPRPTGPGRSRPSVAVGEPSDPVGAEQAPHGRRSALWSTAGPYGPSSARPSSAP